MVPERRSLAECLSQIFGGERYVVSLDHIVLCEASADSVAEALRPYLQRLQQADVAEIPELWELVERATLLLSNLKGETIQIGWAETILAAARAAVSAEKCVTLVEQHLLSLEGFRADPSRFANPSLPVVSNLFAHDAPWSRKLEAFCSASQQRFADDCQKALEALTLGAPCEAWANRLAYSTEVEAVIDSCCSSSSESKSYSFAASCAQSWLQLSLPVLPWILANLLWPNCVSCAGGCAGLASSLSQEETSFQRVRKALEHCNDAQALLQLKDAFTQACSLLLRAAWSEGTGYSNAVAWFSAVLLVVHESCRILFPEVPVGSVAAAITAADSLLTCNTSHPPWEEVLGKKSNALDFSMGNSGKESSLISPSVEELSEAIAQALHAEVQTQAARALPGPTDEPWPGKIAPLLLLFRLLPDAGGVPLQAQARLVALRALQGNHEVSMERRFLEFLQNECGHQHPVLRHLAKVLQETADALGSAPFKALAISAVAASSLQLCEESFSQQPVFSKEIGLSGFSSSQSFALSLLTNSHSHPICQASSISKQIFSTQLQWTEDYLTKYPHRKLLWSRLGVVVLSWRHQKGQTRLTTSERQAHFLLAVDEHLSTGASLEMSGLSLSTDSQHERFTSFQDSSEKASGVGGMQEVLQLVGSNKPLELMNINYVAIRPESDASHLDLRVQPFARTCSTQEPARASQAAHAPVVDAAVVRILKRFHVLTGDEVLRKLSNYPESLDISEQSSFPARDANAAAKDGHEAFARLRALCDRGLLRAETDGEFDLQTRFFYEH
ncbi:Translation initiation factor 2 subunit alpha [Durusdinium trenchii]